MMKIPVQILGASGLVGQTFVRLLSNHPYFQITKICSSQVHIGLCYKDVARQLTYTEIDNMKFSEAEPSVEHVVFSALPANVANKLELVFVKQGKWVFSNASAHRMKPYSSFTIADINPHSLDLCINKSAVIVTNPNCCVCGLSVVLAPISFYLKEMHLVTLQAVSGAGIRGIGAYEIADNVIPFIENEEEKIRRELKYLLSKQDMVMSIQCNRVNVSEGHTLCLTLVFNKSLSINQLKQIYQNYQPIHRLPSSPDHFIHIVEGPYPQTKLHKDIGGGMSVTVGRFQQLEKNKISFVALVHNLIRGAAGSSILNAELSVKKGLIKWEKVCATIATS